MKILLLRACIKKVTAFGVQRLVKKECHISYNTHEMRFLSINSVYHQPPYNLDFSSNTKAENKRKKKKQGRKENRKRNI